MEQLQNPTIGVTINNKSTPAEYPNTYTLLQSADNLCKQFGPRSASIRPDLDSAGPGLDPALLAL